jgi:hypothetical protein
MNEGPFDEQDDLQAIAGENPVSPGTFTGRERSEFANRAYRAITSTPRTPRWHRRMFVSGIALALVVGAGAAAYTLTRPISNPIAVGCYEGTSLTATEHITALRGTPAASCAELWNAGELGSAPHPSLVTCVRSSGTAVVFPTKDQSICSRLGLASVAQTRGRGAQLRTSGTAPSIEKLTARLGEAVLNSTCLRSVEALRDVQQDFATFKIHGWSVVRAAAFSTAHPCVGFAIDPTHGIVKLVPQARHRI